MNGGTFFHKAKREEKNKKKKISKTCGEWIVAGT
jgi:hypothetical protein